MLVITLPENKLDC